MAGTRHRTPRRLSIFVLLAVSAALASSVRSDAAAPRVPPKALYARLLVTPIPTSQLPSGFYSASIGVSKPSNTAKSNHAVGEVEIDLNGGDAAIIYLIFPTRADALKDWKDADPTHKKGVKTKLPAPGFPHPALIVNGSITGNNAFGKKVTNGFSILGFTAGNVITSAVTSSTTNTNSGDLPATISLGKFALRHLRAVEAKVRR
jgi:hypothetical protein